MSTASFTKDDILGIEPKHITYVVNQANGRQDMLVVKEMIHLKDGRHVPNLRFWEDYKRPFWVTSKGYRNHQEKKDHEQINKLQRYSSTQLNLVSNIQKALGGYSGSGYMSLRQVCRSPYVYGADVSSASCLKNDYRERWPERITMNRVSGGDIETNVHSKDQEIICMSVSHRENVRLVYLKSWVSDIADPIGGTLAKAKELIPDLIEQRKLKIEVLIADTPAQVVLQCIEKLHEWKPDFFSFWNIDFDMSKILRALENEGYDPKDVFSDPSVPKAYKYFEFKRGISQKVSASGKKMSKAIEDTWHWVTHPASFQCVDAMTVYRVSRLARGKDPSYSLDYILQKELGVTKLKVEEIKHLSGLRWHEVMQSKHKLEYGVYNIVDSIRLEELDEKTKDLASSITMLSRNSEYKNFNSTPKRLCDDMHFWYLRQKPQCVIATSSDQMSTDLDALVVGHDDWINS